MIKLSAHHLAYRDRFVVIQTSDLVPAGSSNKLRVTVTPFLGFQGLTTAHSFTIILRE